MRLIKGKFYDNSGNGVPLEFGNKEQIRLIEERKALEGGGIAACIHVHNIKTLLFSFRCPCGVIITFENTTVKKCVECGENYEHFETDDWGVPAIRLKK